MKQALAFVLLFAIVRVAAAESAGKAPRPASFQAVSQQTLRQTPDMRDWSPVRRSAYRRSLKHPLPPPLAVLELPRFAERVAVLPGIDNVTLNRAVGHIPGTPAPGQPGNVALSGHRDSYFRPLERIRKGDEVRLIVPGGVREYVVAETWVTVPSDVRALAPAGRDALTLVTCYPFRYYGITEKRFIVRAYPREAAARSAGSRGRQP